MKAVYIKEFGGAENLEIREVENPPTPIKTQILVRVKTSASNRADVLQRRGLYPAPQNFSERVLGLEFAGEVAEIGAKVSNFKIGERGFGITAGGAQAEFVLTEESHLAKIPEHLNFTQAAAIPEAFITAHDAIFTQGDLRKGETLLIHAVGSGVGLAALQLAKAKNVTVFGTTRNADKLEKCKKLGLDFGIVTDSNEIESNPKWLAENIQNQNANRGADVILDLVGAKYFAANLESLTLKGRLILVGLTGGATAQFNLGMALMKRARIFGTVLRSRSTLEKAEATAKFVADVLPLFEKNLIVPNVDKIFSIQNIREAHEYLESNESFGKVILEF